MIPTYENYLKEPQSLIFEDFQKIHADMITEIGSDVDALELFDDLRAACVKYAAMRMRWHMLSNTEKAELDSRRTSCHDSVIVKCNKLARYLKMCEKEAAWREELGDESDPYSRKRIGDYACWLALLYSLSAR